MSHTDLDLQGQGSAEGRMPVGDVARADDIGIRFGKPNRSQLLYVFGVDILV